MTEAIDTGVRLHDYAAERGVLGCMLAGDSWVSKVAQSLRPEDFADPLNAALFKALVDNDSADKIRLLSTLKRDLGAAYNQGDIMLRVSESENSIPSPHNLPHYLEPVRDYSRKRGLRLAMDAAYVQLQGGASFELVASELDKALEQSPEEAQVESKRDQIMGTIKHIEKCQNGEVSPMGVPTGFPWLDSTTRGVRPGDLFVLAARPSVGKTTIGLNIAQHAAMEAGKSVLFFSLEMSARQLMLRTFSAMSDIGLSRLEARGNLTEPEMKKLALVTSRVNQAKLRFEDRPNITLYDVRAIARAVCREEKVDLIVLDYLQLLSIPGFRANERQREVAQISAGLKSLARELGVGALVLCQLNRDSEKSGRKPRISDLRESGSIEQDADCVALLHPHDSDEEVVHLMLEKQRNGATGMVDLKFKRSINKFEEPPRF